jgi:cell division protein FtsI/penicillin-binding protein 2
VHINFKKKRQLIVFFLFCLAFISIIFRLHNIQILNYALLKNKADLQHKILIKLEPERGDIYDNNKRLLALNIGTYSVYAVSKDIKDREKVASILSPLLNLEKDFLADRLNRNKSFVWLKRKITDKEAEILGKTNIDSINLIKETKRFYPNDSLGCHFIGFTGIDNRGLEGLELCYDVFLKGKYGWKNALRDARQDVVHSYAEYLPPSDGFDLILTVDEIIQHIIEKEIINIVKTSRPKGVMIVAMDPYTGGILAMANYPNFNPNHYQKVDSKFFKNMCITDSFEPGSVFKIVPASAVLEEGLIDFEDELFCEEGSYKIGKRILHDYRPYGTLTFREVIEKSSNIGTIKAAERLGEDKLYRYIKKFGFGSKSEIDLPGEENGILRDVSGWSYVDMTTIPMGQGISCTALQLVNAISVIANGGMLMKPFIVRYIVDTDNNIVKAFEPRPARRVIREETSSKMKELLRGVIERGTGKRAKLDDYDACGKTGTAQKVDKNGRYSKNKFVASFIGFAPSIKPRVALVVCVDEPKGKYFGGSVAAPAFKNIIEKILKYLEVPQSEV